MKLRFLTSVASPRWSYMRDQVIDIGDVVPEPFVGFVRGGQAVVIPDDDLEAATVAATEQAVLVRKARRRPV